MTLADEIRQFVHRTYVRPALLTGRTSVRVRAGDVHKDMGLQNRMPAVCGALGSKIFEKQFGLELIGRTGPRQGATATFEFRLLDSAPRGAATSVASTSMRTVQPNPAAPRRSVQKSETVYLVSCVSKKKSTPAAARDLYISDWFVKARNYVEATGFHWFVLSAEYGLVNPDQIIEPYEKTLNTMPISERRKWADRVAAQIAEVVPGARHVVFLAGQRYREFLMDRFRKQGIDVEVPMEGLRIGEQLGWLGAHKRHG